jgi:hypothetical protein
MGWFGGSDSSNQTTTYNTDNTALGGDNGAIVARDSVIQILDGGAIAMAQAADKNRSNDFSSAIGLTQFAIANQSKISDHLIDTAKAFSDNAAGNVNFAASKAYDAMNKAVDVSAAATNDASSIKGVVYAIVAAALGAVWLFTRK